LQQFEGRKRRFPLKAERPHLTRVRLFYWRLHKFRFRHGDFRWLCCLIIRMGLALVLLALSFHAAGGDNAVAEAAGVLAANSAVFEQMSLRT
jgi:hypothetical protein